MGNITLSSWLQEDSERYDVYGIGFNLKVNVLLPFSVCPYEASIFTGARFIKRRQPEGGIVRKVEWEGEEKMGVRQGRGLKTTHTERERGKNERSKSIFKPQCFDCVFSFSPQERYLWSVH